MGKTDDSLQTELLETAKAYQQYYYEKCSDWNLYKQNELHYLRDYIGYALFGLPEAKTSDKSKDKAERASPNVHKDNSKKTEKKGSTVDIENTRDAGNYVYAEKQQQVIKLIHDKVLEHGIRYNSRGNIYCGLIYVVIFNTEQAHEKNCNGFLAAVKKKVKGEKLSQESLKHEVQVYPVPVFKVKQVRTQWTVNADDGSLSSKTTEKIYYIDNGGRVYAGFGDYLCHNTLPKCTMVFPKDGKYQMDPGLYEKLNLAEKKIEDFVSVVWLEVDESPAGNVVSKVLTGTDITTTVVSVASMGVGIASMFTPIGPAIAIASGIGAAISGTWVVGRSTHHLVDRGLHDETIDPIKDRSACGAWIGIAGGAVGLAASGSSALLSRAIRVGATIPKAATVAYDVVLVGNLIFNGVGLSFKSYDIYASYKETEKVSPQDVLMLVGHLFFFCNSVVNVQFAKTIIETSQVQLLKDYDASLRSERHRQEFRRMARNTRAAGTNDVSSNEEIIRGINQINNKDEFFQAMVRNRKSLSASSAKAAFSDGKVTVNSILTIDPIEFANLPKSVRTEIVRNVASTGTDISPGSNTNNSPGVPVALDGVSSLNSAPKTHEESGVKRNHASGTLSRDPDTKSNTGSQSSSPAEAKLEVSTGIKPKIRPNETSYRNFDTRNGTILKEFCSRHSCAALQASPPQIADFESVLTELRSVANFAKIFSILLEIGYKLLEALQRDKEIVLGKVLGHIVQFLWDYVKSRINLLIPRIPVDDPAVRTFLIRTLQELAVRVETEIDVWLEGFKDWLEKKLPQSLSISQFLSSPEF